MFNLTGLRVMGRVDVSRVERVKGVMPSEEVLSSLADTFRALGDATRAKVLYVLSLGEICVCDLSAVLGASDSAVSHQLRILRDMRLVKARREGKRVYYSLDDYHILSLFSAGLEHIKER